MTHAPDLTDRLRAWTYRRQRLGRAAEGPGEALRDVVGVYSSHPTAPLALLARSESFDAASFAELEVRRQALRLPGMRQTIHLLPVETATRIFAATREPVEKRTNNLRSAGLDWEEYDRLKPRVLELARKPVTTGELQAAIETDGRLMTAVRIMARDGLVLRLGGDRLRSDSLRYVATEAWLGQPFEEVDPDESLAWLAEAYLRGYGPARLADFAWWSGVTRRRATAALSGLDTVDIGGGLLLPSDQAHDFERVSPVEPGAMDALPKWDAYTMGLAPDGRQRLVDDEHLKLAYSSGGGGTLPGDGFPLVLVGGRAVARWSHRFERDRMLVKVEPIERSTRSTRQYAHAFDAAGQLLGASALTVEVASSSG